MNGWMAGSRMSDRLSVASNVQHVVVGWINEDTSVESITYEPTALITDVENLNYDRSIPIYGWLLQVCLDGISG